MTDPCVPVLETERLVLRGHRRDDFPASAAMWANPAVYAHISGVASTRELSWARFLRYGGHWLHLGFGYWVVTDRQTGAFLGEAGLADYQRDTDPPIDGTPEAGWALIPEAWSRGIATEAMQAVFGWADDTLECHSYVALFAPENTASIRVAQKVGFTDPTSGRYGAHDTVFMTRNRE